MGRCNCRHRGNVIDVGHGTIFLDEVSEMSPAMQVRLLRVLQEREIHRVGDSRARSIDVRVMAASNKSLDDLVSKGQFREDLYYRLNVITIAVPPLRERGEEDILELVKFFADRFGREFGRPELSITPEALGALCRHDWPGNVRELENTVQRFVVMAGSEEIEVSELPASIRFSAPRQAGLLRSLAEVELGHIRNVLGSVGGNKSEAARILGIDRKTLREKLRSDSDRKR
jgi:two-component system, NtrC family, response regulator HydG